MYDNSKEDNGTLHVFTEGQWHSSHTCNKLGIRRAEKSALLLPAAVVILMDSKGNSEEWECDKFPHVTIPRFTCILGTMLYDEVSSPFTGAILGKAGDKVTNEMIDSFRKEQIDRIASNWTVWTIREQ